MNSLVQNAFVSIFFRTLDSPVFRFFAEQTVILTSSEMYNLFFVCYGVYMLTQLAWVSLPLTKTAYVVMHVSAMSAWLISYVFVPKGQATSNSFD